MTDSGDPMPNWGNVLLVAAGTIATVVGVLLISPLAIRLLASGAARLPVAMRRALRDRPLPGPFRSRASPRSASPSIPVAIVVTATAAEHHRRRQPLRPPTARPSRQRRPGPPLPPSRTTSTRRQTGVDRLAASLDDPTVIPLDVPVDPGFAAEAGLDGRVPVEIGQPSATGGVGWHRCTSPHPELLAGYGKGWI